MGIKYLDFDLLIERTANCYRARVLDSPAGEASIEFEVPFSQTELNDFFLQIGQTRSFETEQTRRIRAFGQSLFESVFQGPVRDRLRASMGEASSQSDGLRIRLRLTGAPELGNLPWEFLYDPGINRFLALSVETPLVRYLETPQMAQPFAVQPPLRILTMICGPQDFPRLDSEREWSQLQDCMQSLEQRGLVSLQRLEPPTLQSLQRQLRREQYHIFHFVGHGIFSRNDQDGYLLFEDAQHGGHRVSGHDLGTILHDHRPLRLVMLNACEGARAALDDQFAGTAQSLIQQGIPAVIAMQFRITDQASILLAREFYGALADGYPVDAALTEARKAIKTEGNDLEWGTPVLYMRSPDGRIFDITQLPAPAWPTPRTQPQDPEKAAKLNRLYTEGLEAFYLGQWETAFQKFQAIVDANPDHKEAADKLEIARKKMQVQALNEQAQNTEKAGDWDKAIQALDKLAAADPGDPDISARMANARRQAQLADLYAEARQLAQAGKWQAIPGMFKEIDQLSPRYPDPDELRTQAQQHLAKARREAELESAYTTALRAFEASDWKTAIRHLRHVRQLDTGYRETGQLLVRAEAELEQVRTKKAAGEAAKFAGSTAIRLGLLVQLFFIALIANFLGRYIVQSLSFHFGIVLQSVVAGAVTWWFLTKVAGKLAGRDTLIILGVCLIGGISILELGTALSQQVTWIWWSVAFILGGIMGCPIAIIAQRKSRRPGWKGLSLIVISWAGAVLIGAAIASTLTKGLEGNAVFPLAVGIEQGVGAFLGGWVTLFMLQSEGNRYAGGAAPRPLAEELVSSPLLQNLPLVVCLIAGAGRLLSEFFGNFIVSSIQQDLPAAAAVLPYNMLGGLFVGLAILWFLGRSTGKLSRAQSILLVSAGVLGEAVIVAIGAGFRLYQAWHWYLLWGAFGLLMGTTIALVAQKRVRSLSWQRLALIAAGWCAGYATAVIISVAFNPALSNWLGSAGAGTIGVSFEQAWGSFVGTWITLAQLNLKADGHMYVGAVRSASKPMHFEWIIPALFGISATSSIVLQLLYHLLETATAVQGFSSFIEILYLIAWGIQSGLIFCWFLSRLNGRLRWKDAAIVMGVALIGQVIVREWAHGQFIFISPIWVWLFFWALFGLIMGAAIARVLRLNQAELGGRQLLLVPAIWSLAFAVAMFLGIRLSWFLTPFLTASTDTALSIQQSMALFIGGWITLAFLNTNRSRRIHWKTVLAGVLGFTLGSLISIPIYDAFKMSYRVPIQILVLGIMGAASLAFPSRSYKRYLGLALAAGLVISIFNFGIMGYLGRYLYRWLFGQSYLLFRWVLSGALIGLILGLDTKRTTGFLICTILGMMAFSLRLSIVWPSQNVPLQALAAAVLGALLAAGWSYLKNDTPPTMPKPIP